MAARQNESRAHPSLRAPRGEGSTAPMASALDPSRVLVITRRRIDRPTRPRRRGHRAAVTASASTSNTEVDIDVIANHERVLGLRDAPKDTLLMFSFGANINPYTLNKRGIGPTASAVARAPNRRLVFQHRGGYASLDEVAPGDDSIGLGGGTRGALGAVHRVSKTELAMVRRWEIGYEMKEIDVVVADPPGYSMTILRDDGGDECDDESDVINDESRNGTQSSSARDETALGEGCETSLAPGERRVRATVFLTKKSARLKSPVVPFAEYLAKIVTGAESMALDEGYVAELVALMYRAPVSSERGAEYFDIAEGWSEDYGFGLGKMFGRK